VVVTTVIVVTGGVGAGGLVTGTVVVVGGGEAVRVVVVVGDVTAGLLGFGEDGFGVRRLVGCGAVDRDGVVAVGRMITVGRTTTDLRATLCA
jgi:hypothetical protein